MRLVTWNCGGAFHKKWHHLRELGPDIAVVSEGCKPDQVVDLGFTSSAWVGRQGYKGLAVYTFGEWRLTQLPTRIEMEWVLPVRIDGPLTFDLFGVWAMNHRARSHPEHLKGVTQPTALIDAYEIAGNDLPVVVAGDFNGNVRWDTPRRPSFQRMCDMYRNAGLTSIYHDQTGEAFGAESLPTHWWRDRKIDGPRYHIDYVWASDSIAENAQIQVGGFDRWVTGAGSDHAAMIVDIESIG